MLRSNRCDLLLMIHPLCASRDTHNTHKTDDKSMFAKHPSDGLLGNQWTVP